MSSQAMPDNKPPTDDLAPPTQPRRAIEHDFLAALADVVSLDDWREVVRVAVERAKMGDARAREWLADYLTGGRSLLTLAATEFVGDTADGAIRRAAADQNRKNVIEDLMGDFWIKFGPNGFRKS